MRICTHILALPAAIIALLASLPPSTSEPWSYNLPAHERYYPEHEQHMRRHLEVQERLSVEAPVGMRKMSSDQGEKFFLDYWEFGHDERPDDIVDKPGSDGASPPMLSSSKNISSLCALRSPVMPHSDKGSSSYLPRIFGRSLYERDFQCPVGTSNCAAIGQPDACCTTGETCISVQDTGNGPVGCCPIGETCGGEVAACDTAAGYTSCPGSANGGCCIPGYSCQGVGCVYVGSSTTTTTLPLATLTTGASTNLPSSSSRASVSAVTVTTTIVTTPPAETGVTTVTQIIVISPSTSAAPSTASAPSTTITTTASTSSTSGQGPLTCTQGYHSCPASLGGGCCPTNRSCAENNLCLATSTTTSTTAPTTTPSTTGSPAAPVRPTSGSDTSNDASSSTTTVVSGCPTGFYMCSAYYLGGCCRVGRNCDSTSCPAGDSTAVVSTSGLVIIAGGTGASVVTYTSTTTTGAGTATASATATGTTGSCASGWFGCAESDGGGCCPGGYVCGASCTATVSGQGDVGKEAPSWGPRGVAVQWGVGLLAVLSGMGMVVL